MSPIDYRCCQCGAAFEVGVGSLLADDYEPGCPACESGDVQTDWDGVMRRFGDVDDTSGKALAERGISRRRRSKTFSSLRAL